MEPPGLRVTLPVTACAALPPKILLKDKENVPAPPIVSLPVTLSTRVPSDREEPKAADVESGAAAESSAKSLVILSVPPVQLNRDGTPPTLIAPTFAVPDCRPKLVPCVL